MRLGNPSARVESDGLSGEDGSSDMVSEIRSPDGMSDTRRAQLSMSGHGKREIDDLLAVALAAGCPRHIAARAAGVSLATVGRRLSSRKFRRKVQALRARAVEMATGRLADGMVAAADELRQLVKYPDPKIRIQAARSLLGIGADLWKAVDQQVRLEAVEDFFAKLKARNPSLFKESGDETIV